MANFFKETTRHELITIILIYLTFIIYIWYCATLAVGINQIYQFNNILRSTIIVMAPILIFVIFILYLVLNNPNGTIS